MKKYTAFMMSTLLLLSGTTAFAWETQRKLHKSENYEMNRLYHDERDGRISGRQANYLERDIRAVHAEENYLKHHGGLSHRREEQLGRELRRDNQAINRAERRW
jgi:hypothetical protein